MDGRPKDSTKHLNVYKYSIDHGQITRKQQKMKMKKGCMLLSRQMRRIFDSQAVEGKLF